MNRILTLDQMKELSIDEIIRLYKMGYRLDDNLGSKKEESKKEAIHTMVDPIIDPFVNFGKAIVSQGYDELAESIVLNSGNGSIFPDPLIDGEFNLVWWNSTDYADPSDDPNKEIVRCINRNMDTLTITRAQEYTAASIKNLSGRTYKMVLSVTAKVFKDLQTDSQYRVDTGISTHSSMTSGIHGLTGNMVGTSDIQSLTNKIITDPSNNIMANSLKSSTNIIDISTSSPTAGQILTATSPTNATWQSLSLPCFFVSLVASPFSGPFPLTVNYNATIIGGNAPYTYLWTFGDGTTSNNPSPSHTFTVNGTFTTILTVTDSGGNTTTSSTSIIVTTGVAVVTTGLAFTESIALPDSISVYNSGPSLSDSYVILDSLAGIYNAGETIQDSITKTEEILITNR